MHLTPFYSRIREASAGNLWHDQDECPLGQQIVPANHRPGRGALRTKCPYCALLTLREAISPPFIHLHAH